MSTIYRERPERDADVAIVGAGPSGLALAIELGSRGVTCIVVERNDRVGYAPRAKTTNVRTRTHLRRWGIAGKLAEASPFGVDYPSDVQFVTKLGGHRVALIPNAMNCNPRRDARYPEHGQWVPQYKLEHVMREHAATLPSVRFSFSTEFVRADQDGDGVTMTIHDEHGRRTLRCAYLVGADGARSKVRELIGATMQGQYGLSRNYNVVFRAPGLAEAHAHGPAAMYWQLNPAAPSLIGPMDAPDVWFFMPTRLPEGVEITKESAATLIRDATGLDLPYEVLSTDEWVASSFIADRYRDRRVFLAGDACHLHPPFGGYGMNMGVADGVDLGWKLAATLQGWGGAALLESYELERRKIHAEVIAEAASNHAVLSNDLMAEGLGEIGPAGDAIRASAGERIVAAKTKEFHTLGTVLGGCYANSPIIADEGDSAPVARSQDYQPASRPGCLAPHVWRADGSSLYDAFGSGFSLLCRPETDGCEIDRARTEAAADGVPLDVVRLTADTPDELYPSALTLVRPDQFVAWRGDHWRMGTFALASGHILRSDGTVRPHELASSASVA